MPKPVDSKRPINGKQPWTWYSPKRTARNAEEAYDTFVEIVGTDDFHSFQEWRRSGTGRPTRVFALTLEQLSKICEARNRMAARSKRKTTKLKALEQDAKQAAAQAGKTASKAADELESSKKELDIAKVRINDLNRLIRIREEAIHRLSQGARLNPVEILQLIRNQGA